jgi:hypothetical protein
MKIKHLALLLIVIFTAIIPFSSASAHHPIWGDEKGTITIPDLGTSYAYYRDLPVGKVDVFTFEGKAGENLYAGINIPAIKGLEKYSVNMALFGPSLPAANHDLLPPEHPENLGALIFPSIVSADFFEPFTQTLYWGRQRIDMSLPADGTYYLLVWQPDNVAGKYVIDSGHAEVFGLGDLFLFPVWWVRVHMFYGHGGYLLVSAIIILGLVLFTIAKRRKTA